MIANFMELKNAVDYDFFINLNILDNEGVQGSLMVAIKTLFTGNIL
jgi:hypothetical protein